MGQTQSSDASPGNEAAPSRSASPPEEGWVRIVCISDTHGKHADLGDVPDGDVLIHAGDYTTFGKEVHARAFNEWLGTLPHPHKLVVNGNHEANAPWQLYAAEILSNATLLRNEHVEVQGLRVFGLDWSYPISPESMTPPAYDKIPADVDVLVCHGPVADSQVDHGKGCRKLQELVRRTKPKCVVSGHIHTARGTAASRGTRFVNAAVCGAGRAKRAVVNGAVVVDVPVSPAPRGIAPFLLGTSSPVVVGGI